MIVYYSISTILPENDILSKNHIVIKKLKKYAINRLIGDCHRLIDSINFPKKIIRLIVNRIIVKIRHH